MNKIYAGIGSRTCPQEVLSEMTRIASVLAKEEFTLRSGGAPGADTAFEVGCDKANGKKEIYLPWKNFNKNLSTRIGVCDEALNLAAKYHPMWKIQLPYSVRVLIARNGYQILGQNLCDPCDFVICYTSDGASSHLERTKNTGGTGQGISIASANNIPIFNLGSNAGFDKFAQHVQLFYNVDV